jgi:hypothetical protein
MKYFDITFLGSLNICLQQRMTLPLMEPAAQFLLPKMKRLLDQRAFGNSTRMLKVAYIFITVEATLGQTGTLITLTG